MDVAKIGLSVVVPVYAGQDYLEALVASINALRTRWRDIDTPLVLHELILVDDAAIDGSPQLIDKLGDQFDWVVPLHLSRNYGQHPATIAGILHTSGDWVVTLDEDLQHPPEKIEELLDHAVTASADIVYANPASKQVHGKSWRDFSSRGFKRTMEWMTGNKALRLVNSYRLMRGPIARAAASVCTHNTYFDIALSWFSDRIVGTFIDMRDERFIQSGKSGYNLSKLIKHGQKMLFSSQLRFLAVGLWAGAALFAFAAVAGVYFFALQVFAPGVIDVEGWTSLFVGLCLSTGLLSVMLGICLQYLSTLVLKAHGHPTFFVLDRSSDQVLRKWFGAQGVTSAKDSAAQTGGQPGRSDMLVSP